MKRYVRERICEYLFASCVLAIAVEAFAMGGPGFSAFMIALLVVSVVLNAVGDTDALVSEAHAAAALFIAIFFGIMVWYLVATGLI